jgi:predicted small secreted protein
MTLKNFSGVVMAASLAFCMTAAAQTAGQDMKGAGHSTKDAAVDTGHGVAKGTKSAAHHTAHGTKHVYHKSTRGTRNLGRRIEGKPTLPNHPQ